MHKIIIKQTMAPAENFNSIQVTIDSQRLKA